VALVKLGGKEHVTAAGSSQQDSLDFPQKHRSRAADDTFELSKRLPTQNIDLTEGTWTKIDRNPLLIGHIALLNIDNSAQSLRRSCRIVIVCVGWDQTLA